MKDRQRRAMFARMKNYNVYPSKIGGVRTGRNSGITAVSVKAKSPKDAVRKVMAYDKAHYPKEYYSLKKKGVLFKTVR